MSKKQPEGWHYADHKSTADGWVASDQHTISNEWWVLELPWDVALVEPHGVKRSKLECVSYTDERGVYRRLVVGRNQFKYTVTRQDVLGEPIYTGIKRPDNCYDLWAKQVQDGQLVKGVDLVGSAA